MNATLSTCHRGQMAVHGPGTRVSRLLRTTGPGAPTSALQQQTGLALFTSRERARPHAAGTDSVLPAGGDGSSRSTSPSITSSGAISSSSSVGASNHQQQQQPRPKAPSAVQELLMRTLASESGGHEETSKGSGPFAAIAALVGGIGGIALLAAGGYILREPIKHFLNFFIGAVDEWGVWGYLAYALVYAGLEVLALPAIPLTMTAGAIFGPLMGTVMVSFSATLAATIAFLISRYLARDKIMAFARSNRRFAAIDRAISQNGLKFVTLLRLSPLLPLALSNYLYGLTSVDLGSYVLGSFIGMMPGTYAYVTAGHLGKAILVEGGEGGLSVAPWQVMVGLGASLLAIGFIGQVAKRAIDEADAEVMGHEEGNGHMRKAQWGQQQGQPAAAE